MKVPAANSARNRTKKFDTGEYLTSWKEIAEYMRSGVRTVQRYEREFGLPIRRPTGKSRGSVIATRAEIDAWIAAAPIRETFKLSRLEWDSRARANTDKIESGINAMRKLKDQMQALRIETRSALNLLIQRVSSFHTLLPPSRADGYEPLVNMNMSYVEESYKDNGPMHHGRRRHKNPPMPRRRNAPQASLKPH